VFFAYFLRLLRTLFFSERFILSGKVEIQSNFALVTLLARLRAWAFALDKTMVLSLATLCVLGFGLRARGVSAIGFAEDETNKLAAIQAYAQGDFTPNAEHPMFMKTLMLASHQAARAFNLNISDEAALRFPNLLFGALTVIPLFLLTAAFFDRWTGLAAAAMWAFGVNAITYNRIGKEDTLLVFFLLFALYFYLRAKQTDGYDFPTKNRFYLWSAISFAFMLASKYFPHYFGLNALYHHRHKVRPQVSGEPSGRTPKFFYVLFIAAFFLLNPAILWPATWKYMGLYAGEKLLTHTGYLMGATLYKNNMSGTPFGATPNYFYLLFLAIKVPLATLLAFLVGLGVALRGRRHPGHAFLLLMLVLWIVPYSLAGAKWLRYAMSLLPLVYMLAAVGMAAFTRWLGHELRRFFTAPAMLFACVGASALFFIGGPAWAAYQAGPHYALYVNQLGAGQAGYYFPHDEFYDDGLREAIKYVCDNAPPGATIVHETPGVVHAYLQKFGREDLQSRVLSDPQFTLETAPPNTFYILQTGRTYFENQDKMRFVRQSCPRLFTSQINGLAAAEVYAEKRTQIFSANPPHP
jgi:hypothetical protein